MKVKTEAKRQRKALKEMNKWLKGARNRMKIKEMWERLASKLQGHYNYYGVSSNSRSISDYYYGTMQLTYKWINRKSQKQTFNWKEFARHLKTYPLPKLALAYNMYDIW